MAKNPKITKKQIKREITAREAAKNLEAFGYTGGPQWASIDNFIKANPRARAAVTADKGAFIQSEALGFSNGGGTFTGTTPEGKKDTFKIGDYYADASKLGNIKKGLLGKTSGYTGVRAAPNMSNPGGGDSNEERDRTQAIKQYRDYLVYQTDEEGKTLQNYGTRGDRD